jgi:hypothetical protein
MSWPPLLVDMNFADSDWRSPRSENRPTRFCRLQTLYVRQSVWNSKEQDSKTENAVRDIDVCSDLAVMLRTALEPSQRFSIPRRLW